MCLALHAAISLSLTEKIILVVITQFVMYNEADILRSQDLVDPTATATARFSLYYRKLRNLMAKPTIAQQDVFVLVPVLKDNADRVLSLLAETHWTDSVVVTMSRFRRICGGDGDNASATLSYLSAQGKARYVSVDKDGHSIQVMRLWISNVRTRIEI